MRTNDFGDSKYYRVMCDCGYAEHDITFEVEADDSDVTVHIWTEVKTPYWHEYFKIDYKENWVLYKLKEFANRWINTADICWTAIKSGYVRMESTTILKRQTAINFADTLVSAVKDVEEFRNKRQSK
jgi:hypothetical protein